MKDIAEKIDRVKDLVAQRHGEGKRYDRTIEEEQIALEFFGEVVASSRRIAVALEKIADAIPAGLDFTTINSNIEQMAWNAGRSFQQGTRTDR